jgi:hypothetical protein
MFKTCLLIALTLAAFHVQAATLIEVKSSQGQSKVWRDGSLSRMDTNDGGYMVVDSKAETMFVVMPKDRRVMDMSGLLRAPGLAGGNGIKVVFSKQGNGPRIAGYTTTQYSYTANGKACGSVLASPQAMKDTGLQDTLDMMQRMATRADALMSAFNSKADPCQRAGTQLSEYAATIGAPMRITATNGQLISEIVRIDKNASLPPDAFAIPEGYQVVNTGQMLRQLPNLQDMMQQMQQR